MPAQLQSSSDAHHGGPRARHGKPRSRSPEQRHRRRPGARRPTLPAGRRRGRASRQRPGVADQAAQPGSTGAHARTSARERRIQRALCRPRWPARPSTSTTGPVGTSVLPHGARPRTPRSCSTNVTVVSEDTAGAARPWSRPSARVEKLTQSGAPPCATGSRRCRSVGEEPAQAAAEGGRAARRVPKPCSRTSRPSGIAGARWPGRGLREVTGRQLLRLRRRRAGRLRLLRPHHGGVAAGRREPAAQLLGAVRCRRSTSPRASCSPVTSSSTTARSATSACTSATARS